MNVKFTFNRNNVSQSIQPGLKAHVQYVSKVVDSPAPSGTGAKSITANGTYYAISEGLVGYNVVDVNVSGGGGSTLIEKTVSANGVYNASSDSADGYSKVTVNVPASAVDTGTKSISTNGTHDVIGYASANVSVPASAVDTGTKSITANGTNQDVIGYAAVDVAVPNSYAAADEGKVVSNGALVAQTSDTVTANDTYDTTLINSLTVNVSGGAISDGIVVTARNASGYATAIDFYGTVVNDYQFGSGGTNNYGFIFLKDVTYKNTVTEIGEWAFAMCAKNASSPSPAPIPSNLTTLKANAFRGSHFTSVTLPVTLTGRLYDNMFTNCSDLTSIYAPGITSLDTTGGNGNGQFLNCTSLETCEIGSVGYGITASETWNFRGCTQSGLTITLYCAGSYADTLLANIRSSATAATIIIKASEATTYNGNSYAAGATMITSTV